MGVFKMCAECSGRLGIKDIYTVSMEKIIITYKCLSCGRIVQEERNYKKEGR